MVLCLFDWRQDKPEQTFSFFHFSPRQCIWAGEGALPVHLGTDPLTTSPGPRGCSVSACSRGTPPGATSPWPGPAAITGMNLFSKICLQPVGTALHEAGVPGSSLWATGCQNKALNFDSLLYVSRVSFKASNQPKALTPSPSPPPWIQK